jgi:ABC-type Mn2+/Zn2+ transport system permease subunit
VIEWILEPLTFSFVVRGLIAGLLAALACATLSPFVVWRGMAFVGDALAHAILPGIVTAFALGVSLFAGALVSAVVAVIAIGLITRGGILREDSAIGVIFAGFFAFGVLLMSRVATFQDLGHILFGNILGVTRGDMVIMAVVVAIVVVGVAASFKELLVTSFDPAHAVAIGLSPSLLRHGLLLLLALTTVVAIQTVGVVLVLALLVTPAAAASMVSRRLGVIMVLSVVFSVTATIVGFYGSYYADIPSGSSIVLTLTAFFVVAALVRAARTRDRAV